MLNIRNGKIPRPQRVVIYGPEGVGKTTLAAQFPEPLFIDTEGGTAHMDVRRIDRPATWDEFIAIINEVAATSGICKTLVVDTADWAEQLATTYICGKYKKNGIEEFGYSKGYVYLAEEFGRFLIALDKVIASGVHVVVTAHAKMRKFEQPDEIDRLKRRQDEGLATPKQIRCLERYGFRRVGTWQFDDASALISRLADNRWRVPYDINPAYYRP